MKSESKGEKMRKICNGNEIIAMGSKRWRGDMVNVNGTATDSHRRNSPLSFPPAPIGDQSRTSIIIRCTIALYDDR